MCDHTSSSIRAAVGRWCKWISWYGFFRLCAIENQTNTKGKTEKKIIKNEESKTNERTKIMYEGDVRKECEWNEGKFLGG